MIHPLSSLKTAIFSFFFFLISTPGMAQTNPAAFDLSGGSFSFSSQTATNTTYPTNIKGWTTGTNNITAITTAAPGADQALVANGIASTTGLSNLGANGFNFLVTGSAPQVGEIVVALNATGRKNLLATWTASDNLATASRVSAIALQYRIGTTGIFTTVASSTYTSNGSSQLPAQTFANIAIPSACDNKAVVQLRWIYWEVSGSGGRDPIRLDDITISSSSSATIDGTITAGEYGTHTDGNNQQSSATGIWFMTSDATNLYIGISGANTTQGAVIYLDKNPLIPVNGGTNADGTLVGNNYDGSSFGNLQFRSDLVVYFKDAYQEYRLSDGSNGWNAPVITGIAYASAGGNVREIAIPWSAIGGKPASYSLVTLHIQEVVLMLLYLQKIQVQEVAPILALQQRGIDIIP